MEGGCSKLRGYTREEVYFFIFSGARFWEMWPGDFGI